MNFRAVILMLCLILSSSTNNLAQTPNKTLSPMITLERTTDFHGAVPYKLSIYADGIVTYEEMRNVGKRRMAKTRMSQADIQGLLSEFERINYFSLKDGYGLGGFGPDPTEDCPQMMTDQPTAYTSLNLNSKTKKIIHYLGCEGNAEAEKLTYLENRIDVVVNMRRWVK
jgi:hypothetical protein